MNQNEIHEIQESAVELRWAAPVTARTHPEVELAHHQVREHLMPGHKTHSKKKRYFRAPFLELQLVKIGDFHYLEGPKWVPGRTTAITLRFNCGPSRY